MQLLMNAANAAVYAVMAFSVAAALAAVLMRNIFHAALALMAVLLGSAAVFIALHADFLAAVQVLIYVGAVITLIIFSIMMTEGLGQENAPAQNKLSFLSFAACVIIAGVLIELVRKTPWPKQNSLHYIPVSTAQLGKSLMGVYALPFEIISVFLLAALIGAIVIAKKDKD